MIADCSTTPTSPNSSLQIYTFLILCVKFTYAVRQYSSCSLLWSVKQHFKTLVYKFHGSPTDVAPFPLIHYCDVHMLECFRAVPSFRAPLFCGSPSLPCPDLLNHVRSTCPFHIDPFASQHVCHQLLLSCPPPRQSFPSPNFVHHVLRVAYIRIALYFPS